MAKYDYDLGIIGGGAAGLTVAAGAAQLGVKTLLVEKESALGGDCLHYGCVPSKTLLKTAQVYRLMKSGAQFGLPTLIPPPVDFRAINARIRAVIAEIQEHDSVARFCRLGALVRFGQPIFTDEHTVDLDGQAVTARSWVVTTGSSPAVPSWPGLAETPYLTNRNLFSLDSLPASLLICGGGPVAVEMAQAFSRLGSQVTVVHRGGEILGREDADLARLVQGQLAAEGVRFRLRTTVLGVRDLGGTREVTLRDEDGAVRRVEASAILVALGRTPNIEGLGLAAIGVAWGPAGITVDSHLRTSHNHIYAAGDVTGGYQFTHVAGYEGGVVLRNAVFHLPQKADYRYVPWCTYTDPELASIGFNEKRALAAGLDYTLWEEEFADNDRAIASGERVGRIKLLLDRREKPLGIQILGPRAGELLSEWVAIMNGRLGLAKMAAAIHPYPTLSELNKKVVGKLFAEKIFSARVRKGLRFFFNFHGPKEPT